MSRHARRLGQAIVEFALILPILVLIFIAIFDFGRAIFYFNTLANSSREGARVAIVNQTVDGGGVPAGATEAASRAVGLDLDPADTNDVEVLYLLPDLSGPCPDRTLGCIAEVRTSYQFQAITPLIGNIVGPIDLESVTQLPIEFTNPPAP